MKPLADRDPYRIGLAAIAALVVFAILVVLLASASFGSKAYTAILQHSAGLRAGESVEVHGVVVGKVKSVALDGDHVKVTFRVKSGIKVGSQSSAAVKVATLLGSHYLEVDPKGGCCTNTIPLARTSVPYNLQDVLNEGTGKLEELDPVVLAKALTTAADTLDTTKEDIGPAIDGVAALSAIITKRGAQTTALLQAARSVSDQLVATSPDLIELMKQSNLVLAEITSRREAIKTLLVQVTTLSKALSTIVTQTKADLKPSLVALNQVVATLNQQDAKLKQTLDIVAPSLRYLTNALGNGPWLSLNVHDPVVPSDEMLCAVGNCK
ncbi:MCE family protein [Nocardioides sp. Kera G14]|uniref:MCE family protein n=1 Tax=Nocardioides sp. Kera G14 TaxID=2884264 RepID=UPI001D12C3DB|nr:MCE family protein [Nocardioides sp. Kera G14]UDY22322.1 MCE family protein [Nocardioides sp. Kera G14]